MSDIAGRHRPARGHRVAAEDDDLIDFDEFDDFEDDEDVDDEMDGEDDFAFDEDEDDFEDTFADGDRGPEEGYYVRVPWEAGEPPSRNTTGLRNHRRSNS